MKPPFKIRDPVCWHCKKVMKPYTGAWICENPRCKLETKFILTKVSEMETKAPDTMHVWADDVSDGYHKMSELYEHRYRLFLALVRIYDNYVTPMGCNVSCWKAKHHDDGTFYEGFFLLGMTVTKPSFEVHKDPEKFDISYHIPMKYWELAKVIELKWAPKYDGYTSGDVLERLLRL